jgi:putative phage-type endonuclease
MQTKEQIADRVNFIGGSDIAAVLGLSRWKTPLEVWAEKTGQIEPPDLSGKLQVELGIELEETVAKLFSKRTGKKVRRCNAMLYHQDYKFLAGHIDRDIVGENAILECKTASDYKTKEWKEDEIPIEYVLQCHFYMAITGSDKAYLACLLGNTKFEIKEIPRDNDTIEKIIKQAVFFWETCVMTKQMPMVSHSDSDVLSQLFPTAKYEDAVDLDDKVEFAAKEIAFLETEKEKLEEKINLHKNNIRAALGDNALGLTYNYKITWKNQNITRIDTSRLKESLPDIYKSYSNTTTNRVLRITERNGK